ncbi:unnamed protein product, partial [Brenthis ino]
MVKHLSRAGHEVTYITPRPPKVLQKDVHIIDISSIMERYKSNEIVNLTGILDRPKKVDNLIPLFTQLIELTQETVENPNVQSLLTDNSQNFDIIIAEWPFNEVYAGFSAIYKCPLIWFSTITPHWMILQLVDEAPDPAVYNVNFASQNIQPFTFLERITELCQFLWGRFVQKIYLSSFESETYEKLFGYFARNKSQILPSLEELRYNASLVLSNSHISLGSSERLPQNVIPIAGFHLDSNIDPLPKTLKTIMDNAQHGVIYFSMGSNLESKYMPEILKQDLLNLFGKLKQTVIWKFEEELLNKPDNVHLLKWAPQHSILAHKNCIIFMTHGGLLSTTEALHFGVPLIGIPGRADQFPNINRAVSKGFAIKVNLSYTLAADLEIALQEMLNNPRYTTKAKELSMIYHDRPVPPADELVHWVEHVAKTGGAIHLRSPALMVSWYQKYYIDLGLLIVAVLYCLKWVTKAIIGLAMKNRKENKKKIQ